jgi:hypothetical protein
MTNQYYWALTDDEYIAHHGILGQKWGIRRYQNADGTLTEEGKKHVYGAGAYGGYETQASRLQRAKKGIKYDKKLYSAEKKLGKAMEKGDKEAIDKHKKNIEYLKNTKNIYMKDLSDNEIELGRKYMQNNAAFWAGLVMGGPVGGLGATIAASVVNGTYKTAKEVKKEYDERFDKFSKDYQETGGEATARAAAKKAGLDQGDNWKMYRYAQAGDKRAQEVVKQWESEKKSSSTEKKGMSSKTIDDKVAYAKKTGKFDMEFLEQNGDMDPTASRYLKGKELENAYKQWLQKTYGQ